MSETAGAAATAPQGPDSAFGRIVGAFLFPVRTFAAIAARPTFLAPLVLWTAASFLVSELVLTRTDWRAVIVEGNAHRENKLSDEQVDRIAEGQRKFVWVYEALAVVVPAFLTLVTAGAVWMGCQAFGWDLRFRQSFGVAAHAFLPGVLASLVLFPTLWGRATIDPQGLDDVLPTNLGRFVSRHSDKVLHSLLGSFDLLSLWTVVLLVLGLSAAAKVSRTRMAGLVLSLWGLYVLGKAGLGIAFS
jgi:Yip1 domain